MDMEDSPVTGLSRSAWLHAAAPRGADPTGSPRAPVPSLAAWCRASRGRAALLPRGWDRVTGGGGGQGSRQGRLEVGGGGADREGWR